MGSMVSTSGLSSEAQLVASQKTGSLWVPPAYMQTSGDREVALASANHKLAIAFVPEIDFALSSLSLYVTGAGSGGSVNIALCEDDGYSLEPNGLLNGLTARVPLVMTSNNAPSPYVVTARDSNNANAEAAGFEAFKAMDGSTATDVGFRSNAAPTSFAPIYWAIDLGAGDARVINRFRFVSFSNADINVRAYPRAFTFWGSNEVSPAYNTDVGWTQLVGSTPWNFENDTGSTSARDYHVRNAAAYRHYKWKITDRNGTAAYTALGEIHLFEAENRTVPGQIIQSLGSINTGVAADVWIRHTFQPVQLWRGKRVWLVFSGEVGATARLSVRRWNTNPASMFPDGCESKENDGNTWTQSLQENKPALMNVVLNSTQNHVPQLMYGRQSGKGVYLPQTGFFDIPESGITLNCEALTAGTLFSVYLSLQEGSLRLDASETKRAVSQGVEVKSDDPSCLFLGIMYAFNHRSTFQGPIDVMDWRGVAYRGMKKIFGKWCPFAAETYEPAFTGKMWIPASGSDYKVYAALLDGSQVYLEFSVSFNSTSNFRLTTAIGMDSMAPPETCLLVPVFSSSIPARCYIKDFFSEGVHYYIPLISVESQMEQSVRYYNSFPGGLTKASLVGSIEI
ncbi:DUF5000 domain-containing lipoprotein [Desulfomonile tiedjei]|uniref:Uncharacterized protein n=1 Tax=Desulfomonile tiedjei (strain ATCC 49306 / DSM 6799 / DCB-1) TaxID=706587 RepID=I4C8T7_DESTA|nr:DUF5000 domain-containing lipoprotein [Desulfomonile tiedjei]AFM25978.1 hypothetical protein Desti_3320 [Desulfomonile tiedjei DSM 6799]